MTFYPVNRISDYIDKLKSPGDAFIQTLYHSAREWKFGVIGRGIQSIAMALGIEIKKGLIPTISLGPSILKCKETWLFYLARTNFGVLS
jgi:hypothetical protein